MLTKEKVLKATKQDNRAKAVDFAGSQRKNVNSQVQGQNGLFGKKPKNT